MTPADLDAILAGATDPAVATLARALREAREERDAALAAVDAVRADYAPRAEPPTADEVRRG